MEPANAAFPFWWLLIPVLVLLYLWRVAWPRLDSRAQQVALASVVLGFAGMLFWPLGPVAYYCSRKSRQLGLTPGEAGVSMARMGAVLGIIGSVFLAIALLVAAIYLYAWATGQYLSD